MNFHDILMLRGFVGGGSGGGAKTWDDLGYSPTGGDTLTWDGNTEGLVSNDSLIGEPYYLVSNSTPTLADCSSGVMGVATDLGPEHLVAIETVQNIIFLIPEGFDIPFAFVVAVDNLEIDGLAFEKKGVYFLMASDGLGITSLTIPGYTGFPSVNKVPEKYLPEDYIRGLITEELGVIENGTY